MDIIPTILTDSMTEFHNQLNIVHEVPEVSALQVDVIDGSYIDNITVTPLDLTLTDFEPLKIDFHLMTEEPLDLVYECAAVKEYLPIRNVIAQVERMSHQQDFLDEVRKNGWQPILALDLFTPLDAIDEEIWSKIHHILLMSVEVGHQGVKLHQHIYEKIHELRQKFPSAEQMSIMIDGGVNESNIKQLQAIGVNQFVVGSAIWQASEPVTMLQKLLAEN